MAILLFVAGLVILVVSSNLFVDVAVRLAQRFHVSEMLIGATVVSIGTTLPELMVSATASLQGHADMSAGNAVGSIICNTALIAGLVQAIRPSPVEMPAFRRGYLQFFLALTVFCLMGWLLGGLNWVCGAILVGIFLFNMAGSYRQAKGSRVPAVAGTPGRGPALLDCVLLLAQAGLLFLGARLLVENGAELARWIGIPEHVISISLIALGTSLPELLTAISALAKGHGALSLGNIIGANTLNLLWVAGISSIIAPLPFAESLLRVDLPLVIGVSAILALPTLFAGKIRRWQGILLLAVYAGYMVYLYLA